MSVHVEVTLLLSRTGSLIFWFCDITLITHRHNFAIFSQMVNTIEKLLAAFNMQPKICMTQSLI